MTEIFKCGQCDKEYKRESNLLKHINKQHNLDDSHEVLINPPVPNRTIEIPAGLDEITNLAHESVDVMNFVDWTITDEQLQQERLRISQSKDTRIYRKAILWYIYSPELMLSEFKDLPFIDSIVRVYGTNKAFILTKPIASFKGKPVYAVRGDFPISIGLELADYSGLKEKPMSPSEIDAICFSNMLKKAFQHNKFDKQIAIYFILSILLSVVSTAMVFILYIAGMDAGG
jgi:hypothetical protein